MTEYRLKPKRNAYRFRGGKIDVIAELPKEAAARVRAGLDVTVIVDVPEPKRTGVNHDHDAGRRNPARFRR